MMAYSKPQQRKKAVVEKLTGDININIYISIYSI